MINKSKAGGVFRIQCLDPNGNLKWEAESHNLVVNTGLKYMNDVALDGGAQITTWYIGLITGPGTDTTYSGGQTMASHGATGAGGWTEDTSYSNATRPTCAFGPATTADPSVITNTGSAAAFNINGSAVIGGAFLTSDNTKGGTTGTLFSAADFTGGDRSVGSGDTLNVTYTFSLDAA
jgi:hypothetical protein